MPEDKNSTILQAVKAYGKNLLSFIRRRVKTDADAEDILQDVWYQLSAVINSGPIEQTGAWLYRVATNKITDKYRKKSETLLDDLFLADEYDDEGNNFKAILMTAAGTPETAYLRNLFWDELYLALNELPAEQRQAWLWHEIDDMTFAEMAELTGTPIQTLVSRKRYAVLHLRERLQQLYIELHNIKRIKKMRNVFYRGRFIFIPIAAAAFLSAISFIVMQLWNNLLPAILHVNAITFWQAMGIFVLCKILFGFGKGGRFGNRDNWFMHRRMEERFKGMTPEEREQFKQKMGDRMCGPRGSGWGRRGWEAEAAKAENQPDL